MRRERARARPSSHSLTRGLPLSRRFSLIKIVTLLGLILLGIIITAGGVPGTEPIGFRCASSQHFSLPRRSLIPCRNSPDWHETPFQQLNDIPGAKGRFLYVAIPCCPCPIRNPL